MLSPQLKAKQQSPEPALPRKASKPETAAISDLALSEQHPPRSPQALQPVRFDLDRVLSNVLVQLKRFLAQVDTDELKVASNLANDLFAKNLPFLIGLSPAIDELNQSRSVLPSPQLPPNTSIAFHGVDFHVDPQSNPYYCRMWNPLLDFLNRLPIGARCSCASTAAAG